MKFIESSIEDLTQGNMDPVEVYKRIETIGRICYKSEDRITDDSYKAMISNLIKNKHLSVLEHQTFTFKIICDRGVSHELVRHRIASYTQESTRYCNYGNSDIKFIIPDQISSEYKSMLKDDKFINELTAIDEYNDIVKFCETHKLSETIYVWIRLLFNAEKTYKFLIGNKVTPQNARSILPNALKTEIVITMNARELRHFFELRCDKSAHPDMVVIANKILEYVNSKYPLFFNDLYEKFILSKKGD